MNVKSIALFVVLALSSETIPQVSAKPILGLGTLLVAIGTPLARLDRMKIEFLAPYLSGVVSAYQYVSTLQNTAFSAVINTVFPRFDDVVDELGDHVKELIDVAEEDVKLEYEQIEQSGNSVEDVGDAVRNVEAVIENAKEVLQHKETEEMLERRQL